MDCFSTATNFFGSLRLSEVVVKCGDIRMQEGQELPRLCFLCDHIRFERQFLFFILVKAFLELLYNLDPAFDLVGIQVR